MRIEALTFFRFIAALIVVIGHFGRESGLAALAPGLLTSGPQMVTFFFVLSGFVLMLAYYRPGYQPLSASIFWWARASRLLPLYLIALGLAVIASADQAHCGMTAFVLNGLLLQSWFPPYPLTCNGPAWSLSVEAFFYLTFPFGLLYLVAYRPRPHRTLMVVGAFWVFSQAILNNLLHERFYAGFPSISFDLIHYLPLTHLASFWLGVAGGYWLLQGQPRHLSYGRSVVALTLTAAAIVIAIGLKDLYVSPIGFRAPLHAGFFAPLFLAFILAVAQAHPGTVRWLSARPLVLLGEASYGVYILQAPIHGLLFDWVAPPSWSPQASLPFYTYCVILVSLSVVLFLTLERPITRRLRSWHAPAPAQRA